MKQNIKMNGLKIILVLIFLSLLCGCTPEQEQAFREKYEPEIKGEISQIIKEEINQSSSLQNTRKNCREMGGYLCTPKDRCALDWLDSTDSYCCPIECNACTDEELERCTDKRCYKARCSSRTDFKCVYEEEWCANMEKSEKPNIKLFIMSHDYPPNLDGYFDNLPLVSDLFKNKIEIELHYVLYNNYMGGSSDFCESTGEFCSMHGVEELEEDVRQVCIQRLFPEKLWAYLNEFNSMVKKHGNSDSKVDWTAVAKSTGIETSIIEECYENDKMDILKEEMKLNEAYAVTGSPTFFINDARYPAREKFKDAICVAFISKPKECEIELVEKTNDDAVST